MDFCFCLSIHLRIKHNISCLYKCRSYVETKILKESGGQEILETWDIPILVAQFFPHLLSVIPSHYVYSMVHSCS